MPQTCTGTSAPRSTSSPEPTGVLARTAWPGRRSPRRDRVRGCRRRASPRRRGRRRRTATAAPAGDAATGIDVAPRSTSFPASTASLGDAASSPSCSPRRTTPRIPADRDGGRRRPATGTTAARSTSFPDSTAALRRWPAVPSASSRGGRRPRVVAPGRGVAEHGDPDPAHLDGDDRAAHVVPGEQAVRLGGGRTSHHCSAGDRAGEENPSDDSVHGCLTSLRPEGHADGCPRDVTPWPAGAGDDVLSRGWRVGRGRWTRPARRRGRAGARRRGRRRARRDRAPRATRSGPARPPAPDTEPEPVAGSWTGHGPAGRVGPVDPEDAARGVREASSGDAPASELRSVAAEPLPGRRAPGTPRSAVGRAAGAVGAAGALGRSREALVRQPGRRRRPAAARPRPPRRRRAGPPGPGPGRPSWSGRGRRRVVRPVTPRTASVTGSSATTATSRTTGASWTAGTTSSTVPAASSRTAPEVPSRAVVSPPSRPPTGPGGAGSAACAGPPRTRAAPTAPPTRAPRSSQRRTVAVGMRPWATSSPQRCRRPPGTPLRWSH